MELTGIYVYPIKSLRGIQVDEWQLEKRGLKYDRRWMLIDKDGRFLTQRRLPAMTFLQPRIEKTALIIEDLRNTSQSIAIPLDLGQSKTGFEVKVWDSTCLATTCGEMYDRWFSEVLGLECQLVRMPENSVRKVNPKYAEPGEMVSFADGYPYLIIGERSLKDLNSKLETPIEMERFRPNITFSGGAPYVEDSWKYFSIGNNPFRGVKPCARCVMTTIDVDRGTKGKEPLATLATYRQVGHDVLFGLNACYTGKKQSMIIRTGELINTSSQQYK